MISFGKAFAYATSYMTLLRYKHCFMCKGPLERFYISGNGKHIVSFACPKCDIDQGEL